jgi:uncharacterized SAM-dependent methyltransferase
LGCGGGQKDCRLIQRMLACESTVAYIPSDVSLPLVLTAQKEASTWLSKDSIHPLVADFGTAADFDSAIECLAPAGFRRVLTFFGMIPNFEPDHIITKLSSWVNPGDWLLFSANLAPGADYDDGIRRILPGYDNALTRDWLMTFLTDLGVSLTDGFLRFEIEEGRCGVKRIVARFHFVSGCVISVEGETFEFHAGDAIRLFYSYRYTPAMAAALLRKHQLDVCGQWIAGSGEEGVFLCQKH